MNVGPAGALTLDTITDHLQQALGEIPEPHRTMRVAAMLRCAAQWGRQTARHDRWERAVEAALQVRYPDYPVVT